MKEDQNLDQKFKEIFAAASRVEVESDFQFKPSVTNFENSKKLNQKISFWKSFALVNVFSIVIILCLTSVNKFPFFQENPTYPVLRDNVYVINLELKDSDFLNAEHVAIHLPDGVTFFSYSNENIADKRNLQFPIEALEGLKALPITFQTIAAGKQQIEVSFFDANKRLTQKKYISIKVL